MKGRGNALETKIIREREGGSKKGKDKASLTKNEKYTGKQF